MNSMNVDDRPTRRLSAVMFTDMVGYSGLVQRNERVGLELLAEQRDIVRRIIAANGGREVDTAGDSFFVEFTSALAAVQCAVAIQERLHERNADQPAERHIILRIGLHLGDVVHVGNQVQGDGVNIAARMEPLARPGSICLSEDVARQVHNKIDLPVAPLGKKRLKNIRLSIQAFRIVLPWEDDFGVVRPFHEFSSEPTESSMRRLPRSVGVVLAAAIVGLLIWQAAVRLLPPEPGPDAGWSSSLVAVLPFSVQGSPEFAYLGTGMVDLLSTKLDGAGALKTVDPRAILGRVAQTRQELLDPVAARELSRSLGAGTYVLGNIVEVGGKLRIDATMYSGESADRGDQGTVEGAASEIFDLLDRLAAQLVVRETGGPGVPLERLEAMTTSSFVALKHYLQGVDAFRSARFQEAADELGLAVEEDSTFALAWYQLSATAEWLFDPVLAAVAITKAGRHADRLSERDRRLVDALRAAKSGRNGEAFQLYREFLSSYPDDVEAWYQLGELIFHAGPMIGISPEESLEAWQRLVFFEPDQITALIHMARIWQYEGALARVDSVAQLIFDLEPSAERNVELRTHLAFNRNDETAVREAERRLDAVSDDMLMDVLWSVASFRRDLAPARRISAVLTGPTRSDEVRGAGHVARAYLLAAGGRFEEAEKALTEAAEAGSQEVPAHRAYLTLLPFRSPSQEKLASAQTELERWRPDQISPSPKSTGWYSAHNGVHPQIRDYLLGLVFASTGKHAEATRLADALEKAKVPDRAGSLAVDLGRGIRSQIALSLGDYDKAGRVLRELDKHSYYQFAVGSPFFSLGRERYIEGRLAEDDASYDEAIRLMSFFQGHSVYDKAFVAPAHLRRASAYRMTGNPAAELRHLNRFVALWTGCDEEFQPLLDEAKARIAELSR